MTRVRIERRSLRFTIVDDRIYAQHDLSPCARLILGWLLGRGDGYELRVATIMSVHALGVDAWRTVRRQLERGGWIAQRRWRSPGGTWLWELVVSDDALVDGVTILGLAKDGASGHGGAVPGHPADIPTMMSTISEPPPPQLAPKCIQREEVGSVKLPEGLQQYAAAVIAAAAQAGCSAQLLVDELGGRLADRSQPPVKNPAAWARRRAQTLARDGAAGAVYAGRAAERLAAAQQYLAAADAERGQRAAERAESRARLRGRNPLAEALRPRE